MHNCTHRHAVVPLAKRCPQILCDAIFAKEKSKTRHVEDRPSLMDHYHGPYARPKPHKHNSKRSGSTTPGPTYISNCAQMPGPGGDAVNKQKTKNEVYSYCNVRSTVRPQTHDRK